MNGLPLEKAFLVWGRLFPWYNIRMWKRKNKHGNVKTDIGGVTYDSKAEARYSATLELAKKAKNPSQRVVSWEPQVHFVLQEAFRDSKGKAHRKMEYLADFVVKYADGREEVVDVKGFRTEVYKIKKKLLLFKYPEINFVEIKA